MVDVALWRGDSGKHDLHGNQIKVLCEQTRELTEKAFEHLLTPSASE